MVKKIFGGRKMYKSKIFAIMNPFDKELAIIEFFKKCDHVFLQKSLFLAKF